MIHPFRMFWRLRRSGRRLESVYAVPNSSRFPSFSQLGKRCQVGLLGLGFAPGLAGLRFS
jgi:hypothetical protein